MSNDLYFISIIARALEQEDTKRALEQAFEEIESLGAKPGYEQGFQQFQRLMDVVSKRVEKKRAGEALRVELARELIIDLASDAFEGSAEDKRKAMSIIRSNPQWRKEYDQLVGEIEELSQIPEGVEISVSRENKPFKSVTFLKVPGSETIDNVTPGHYNIAFATGRLIWEGELAEQDLIWVKAYPGQPFEMAAETTEREAKPTKRISVFEGQIGIEVFAGIESGRIRITIKASGDPQ